MSDPDNPDTNHNIPAGSSEPVSYPVEFTECCIALAKAAQRKIRIYSPTLEHAAFDSQDLAGALAGLARRSRACDIRILISDSRAMVNRGHRLLSLSRRLPSIVNIQKLAEHPELPTDIFMLSDSIGLVYKPLDADQAFYAPEQRAKAQGYAERFDALWNRSQADNELRELRI
ncbi:hypothetical protein EYC98_10170 [Halieaceae bacterium IMCC14734]|uniref:DUF7931 domain-containing protein n=1 Tax=Candidatus Litorirhabdus singularis TaxID=2518993 RepID=A0ABT3TIP8_9GAMM|nr:hypothetical protein [Candidatus Litorirhabdus singularis]MCX2981227.1 hypothetical protein [Candidatus Litorirhabdus singularis]